MYAGDADFDKRTSNLEETVRVLQNTLTDIHPIDKGYQAVVRAGEIVPLRQAADLPDEKRMGELEQQVTTLSTQCTDLELQLQASIMSTTMVISSGGFPMRPDVSMMLKQARAPQFTALLSPALVWDTKCVSVHI